MSWRWCLHEALPYVHQTNMSWKHSPTHGLTAFKSKYTKFSWNNKIFIIKIFSTRTIIFNFFVHVFVHCFVPNCSNTFCYLCNPYFDSYSRNNMFVTRITINAHEFIINLCIFFAPMEQKSEKIFLRIKGSYEPEINNNFWIIYGQFMDIRVIR